jgi:hypothetical protein
MTFLECSQYLCQRVFLEPFLPELMIKNASSPGKSCADSYVFDSDWLTASSGMVYAPVG